jgi:hypothetical protein
MSLVPPMFVTGVKMLTNDTRCAPINQIEGTIDLQVDQIVDIIEISDKNVEVRNTERRSDK